MRSMLETLNKNEQKGPKTVFAAQLCIFPLAPMIIRPSPVLAFITQGSCAAMTKVALTPRARIIVAGTRVAMHNKAALVLDAQLSKLIQFKT